MKKERSPVPLVALRNMGVGTFDVAIGEVFTAPDLGNERLLCNIKKARPATEDEIKKAGKASKGKAGDE